MPIGSVIAVFSARPSQIPGSGWTTPNPVSSPRPTQPDQIATNAGSASTTTGHARTGRCTPPGAMTATGAVTPTAAALAGKFGVGSAVKLASSAEALPAPTRNSR